MRFRKYFFLIRIQNLGSRVVDPEWFFSVPTPDPDPTIKEVLALTPDPELDPDTVSDPATLVSACKCCAANSHCIRKITTIYIKFFRK